MKLNESEVPGENSMGSGQCITLMKGVETKYQIKKSSKRRIRKKKKVYDFKLKKIFSVHGSK